MGGAFRNADHPPQSLLDQVHVVGVELEGDPGRLVEHLARGVADLIDDVRLRQDSRSHRAIGARQLEQPHFRRPEGRGDIWLQRGADPQL